MERSARSCARFSRRSVPTSGGSRSSPAISRSGAPRPKRRRRSSRTRKAERERIFERLNEIKITLSTLETRMRSLVDKAQGDVRRRSRLLPRGHGASAHRRGGRRHEGDARPGEEEARIDRPREPRRRRRVQREEDAPRFPRVAEGRSRQGEGGARARRSRRSTRARGASSSRRTSSSGRISRRPSRFSSRGERRISP